MKLQKELHVPGYLGSKVKEFFDILLSLLTIMIFFPVFIIASIAVKFEDGGKILYVQERVGKNGKIFKIYKIRTMKTSVEEDTYAFPKVPNNPRITKIGRIIRPYVLDEFPQILINILIFRNMSFVGVRPLPEKQFKDLLSFSESDSDLFSDQIISMWKQAYYSSKPGFVSLASINGGANLELNKEGLRKKMDYDIEYIRQASVFFDLWIIKEGILALIFRNVTW